MRLVSLLAVLLVALPPAVAAGPLVYVESSIGLDAPEWEGGDSEFEMFDVDADGHVDLVSIGDHGNPLINATEQGIMVWFGNGTGSWSYGRAGHLGYGGCALGDVDLDGTADIAYGMHHDYGATDLGDQKLEVALGDGTGLSWTPWDDGLADEGQDWGMFSTDLGDIDGDGDLDVGSSAFGADNGMHVYLNELDGSWRRSFGFLGGNSGHVFRFGDVDGDGHLDIATAKNEGTVWLGDGEGFFSAADGNLPPRSEFDYWNGPALGDVDGDGRDDLSYCDRTGDPHVWLWRGSATWEEFSTGLPALGGCRYTELWDMDGDGSTDLVTFGGRQVHVYGRTGDGGAWTEIGGFSVPDSPGTAHAFRVGGDVDHNGRPDIVTLAEGQAGFPFDTRNRARAWREASPPAALRVRLVRPVPHRVLLAGAVRFIDWATEVPVGQTARIRIELSTGGAGGPWEPVAEDLPDNGRYQWRVPPRISEDCYLRLTATTASGTHVAVGSGPFTIARRPDPLELRFTAQDELGWTDALDRRHFHLYRGDWQRFLDSGEYTQDPALVPEAARFCDLEQSQAADPFVPAPGRLAYWLVTGFRMMEDGRQPGVPVAMAEGALGQDGAARMRPNDHRCGP